ncbi:tetratricopeptide repeat protein [Oleidesulfovibrio sp.]|uniref:tetratricopeptide repeat protein n=1 Tax=Oleidesulfovibrio sp. TaxID=2909707 RepID=UPI003A8533D1
MSLSKQELKELAAQVEQGVYVKRSTLYIAVGIALVAGMYIGNLLTSTMSQNQPVTKQRVTQVTAGQTDATQVPAAQMAQILDLEKHLQHTPDDVAAWTKLGHLYFDTNQPKPAIRAYNKSLELKPDDANVITDLGVMYRRDHQHQLALETFERAIAVDPTHEVSRFNKGIVLFYDLKKKDEAFATWNELVQLNPNARTPGGTPVKEMINQLKAQ